MSPCGFVNVNALLVKNVLNTKFNTPIADTMYPMLIGEMFNDCNEVNTPSNTVITATQFILDKAKFFIIIDLLS